MFVKLLGLLKNPFERWFLWLLFVINILGSVYGFYWYRYQISDTPWYYLIFVPDSPLSTTLFCIALLTIQWQKKLPILKLWAYFWLIKYGIWAVIINIDVAVSYTDLFSTENLLLAISHAGMALEGFLFLRYLKFKSFDLIIISLWLIINDFMDYVLNLHPYLFDDAQLRLARFSAISLSILLILAGFYLLYYRQNNKTISNII